MQELSLQSKGMMGSLCWFDVVGQLWLGVVYCFYKILRQALPLVCVIAYGKNSQLTRLLKFNNGIRVCGCSPFMRIDSRLRISTSLAK